MMMALLGDSVQGNSHLHIDHFENENLIYIGT